MGDLMVDRELDDDTRVVFCIPCLKRDQQLLAALAINCVLWWPMRKYWRIAVCTFGADVWLCVELKENFTFMIELGLLVIASGGAHGKARMAEGSCEKPSWMPDVSHEALPGDTSGILGMPELIYWHASLAKNAAHQLANHAFGENCCWVNLDCDQICPLDYVCATLKLYAKHRNVQGMTITCDVHAQMTGRIACRGEDWLHLGGYDEDGTPPSGGQDVDLRVRLGQLAMATPGMTKKQHRFQVSGTDVVGGALANDFENTTHKHDRSTAKTANVSPQDRERYKAAIGKTSLWSSMNDIGWRDAFKPRQQRKEFIRNTEMMKRKISLGVWFAVVARTPRMDDNHFIKGVPPHAACARMEADSDEDDWLYPGGSELSIPRVEKPLGVPAPTSVEMLVVGAAELYQLNKTQNTPLGLHTRRHFQQCARNTYAAIQYCTSCVRADTYLHSTLVSEG